MENPPNSPEESQADAPDVYLRNQGTVIGFYPRTPLADEVFAENLETEPWQWLGGVLWVGHREAQGLHEYLRTEHGLTFGMVSRLAE